MLWAVCPNCCNLGGSFAPSRPKHLLIKRLLSKKHRRAARRAAAAQLELPPDPQGWQPGQIHKRDDTAEAYQTRLVENILAENPGSEPALQMIHEAIDRMPDADQRDHTRHHLVRLLQTYALVPKGPGTLVDVAASPIYAAPLRGLKHWHITPIEILAFDYERDPLPFEDGSQDGVMLCEVMEHFIIDPLFCFNEINRVLKKGGFFVVTTPNVVSWFSIYQALRNQHPNRWPVYAGAGDNEPNHIHSREYMVSEMVTLLEAAGFAVDVILTRDYGIMPEYEPIPGFDATHRGETIFCRARKVGPPKMRYARPVYLQDLPYTPPDPSVFRHRSSPSLLGNLHQLAARLRPAPAPVDPAPPVGRPTETALAPALSNREAGLLARLQASPPHEET